MDLILALVGAVIRVDVAIVSTLTTQSDLQRTRAKYDCHAANAMISRKQTRYPNQQVLPFVLEDFGRASKPAISLIRTLSTYHPDLTPSQASAHLWQAIQTIIHSHTAHIIRAAERLS